MSYQRETLIARRGYSDTSGFSSALSSLWSGFTGVMKGTAQSEGEAKAYAEIVKQQQDANASRGGGGTPSWLLPVGVVAGVGVLALVLIKRKGK